MKGRLENKTAVITGASDEAAFVTGIDPTVGGGCWSCRGNEAESYHDNSLHGNRRPVHPFP